MVKCFVLYLVGNGLFIVSFHRVKISTFLSFLEKNIILAPEIQRLVHSLIALLLFLSNHHSYWIFNRVHFIRDIIIILLHLVVSRGSLIIRRKWMKWKKTSTVSLITLITKLVEHWHEPWYPSTLLLITHHHAPTLYICMIPTCLLGI